MRYLNIRRTIALTSAITLLAVGSAAADTVELQRNALDTSGSASGAPGSSGSVFVWVAVTNGSPSGDQSGCNADPDNPVTVTISSSDPTVVAIGAANSVEVSECGSAHGGSVGYTIAASATAGQSAVLSGSVSGGKVSSTKTYLYDTSDTFTVTVTAPTGVAPTVGYTIDPDPADGSAGWYRSDVTLTWNVTGDPAPTLTGCENQSITADQAATEYSCSATNSEGTDATSVTIKRDATPPTSTVAGVTEGAVYVTAPTVTCSATDDLSGVATHGTPSGNSTGAGSKTVTCNGATDVAGNTQTVASAPVTYTLAPIGGFNTNFDGGAVLKVKPNQAIPLSWAFNDGTANLPLLSSASLVSVSSPACTVGGGLVGSETAEVAAGASGLQLLPDNSYQMNWKATSTTGCRALTVNMALAAGGSTSRTIYVNISK